MNTNGRWHQLVIEANTPTRSASGAQVDSWATWATVYGRVEPGRSREFVAARATQTELTHEIMIRYTAGVRPDMRIKFGSRYFYIAGPPRNPQEQNEWLIFSAVER